MEHRWSPDEDRLQAMRLNRHRRSVDTRLWWSVKQAAVELPVALRSSVPGAVTLWKVFLRGFPELLLCRRSDHSLLIRLPSKLIAGLTDVSRAYSGCCDHKQSVRVDIWITSNGRLLVYLPAAAAPAPTPGAVVTSNLSEKIY